MKITIETTEAHDTALMRLNSQSNGGKPVDAEIYAMSAISGMLDCCVQECRDADIAAAAEKLRLLTDEEISEILKK